MSVHTDYRPRTMGELENSALEVLHKWGTSLPCSVIGEGMFEDHAHVNGNCPYARIAGRVMRRLREKNLAVCDRKTGHWSLVN